MNTPTTNDIIKAQSFLSNYQAQTKNSLYSEMNAILTRTDATKNSSVEVGNLKLNITVFEKDTPSYALPFFLASYFGALNSA